MAENTKGAATPTTDANVLPTLVHQANDLAAFLEHYKKLLAVKVRPITFLNNLGYAKPGYIDSQEEMTPMNKIYAAMHGDMHQCTTYQVYRIKTRVPGDIRVNKGEHGMSLTHTMWNYYKAKKGEAVEEGKEIITLADYKKLSKEEQAKYAKSPQRQVRNAFNIDQTDIPERTEEYQQIVHKYGSYAGRVAPEDRTKEMNRERMALNAYIKAVSENMTRIAKASTQTTHYDAKKDVINLAAQSNYETYADYTQDVNRQIISATGNSERRGRRGAASGSNATPSIADMAKEALIVELASAARQLDMGMPANISEANEQYIDTWIESLKSDPNYLVDVEREVSIACKMVADAAAGIKIERKSDKLNSALAERVPENAKTYSEVQVTAREDGRWCIYFGDKETKLYQSALLAAADTSAYFEQLRHFGQQHEKVLDFKQHLAQAYADKIAKDPTAIADNLFYDKVDGADVVEKASIYTKEGKSYICPTIDGKRHQSKEITWSQYHRLIIAPDRNTASKGLAALLYQDEVKKKQESNQKAAEAERLKIAEEKAKQEAKEAEEKKAKEAKQKEEKAKEAEAKSKAMKTATFYTVAKTLKLTIDTRAFDKFAQDFTKTKMLDAAENFTKDSEIDLTSVVNDLKAMGGTMMAKRTGGSLAVIYHDGDYHIMKAVSEEDIRTAIEKNGLPPNASPVVKVINERMQQEKSEKSEETVNEKTEAVDPRYEQWKSLKEKHPDALLLFRVGDFYEAYAEDAKTAAKVLGLTLINSSRKRNAKGALAGFPHHALDTYLPKLIRAGHRVAICDQLEDVKQTKQATTQKQSTKSKETKTERTVKNDVKQTKEREVSPTSKATGEVLRFAEEADFKNQHPIVYLNDDLSTPRNVMMTSHTNNTLNITLENGEKVKLEDLYVVDKEATKEALRPQISEAMEATYSEELITFEEGGSVFKPRFRQTDDQIVFEGDDKDGRLLQFSYEYDYDYNFGTNYDMALDKLEQDYNKYREQHSQSESKEQSESEEQTTSRGMHR